MTAERSTELDGLRISARVWEGSGTPAFVLVHGIAVSSRYFVPLARELAVSAPVAAPDLPGFGRSSKPRRALGVQELARALEAWLDTNDLERPVLVANSFGCQVAVDLAARAPGRVARLVLIGPTTDPGARSRARQVARWMAAAFRDRPPLHLVIARDAVRSGLVRTWATFEHALRDPVEEKLPAVACPTLVLRGERDPIAPQAWCERAASLLPEGRLVVVPGGGHALNWSRPRDTARAILAFLALGEKG